MAAFVIFDQSTGAIRGTYQLTHAAQLAAAMKANTPTGCGALEVPMNDPSAHNNIGWKVVDGKLVATGLVQKPPA